MKKTLIAISVAALACANMALADIIPPGYTTVPVCAYFSNTESMLDIMAVYGYETSITGGAPELSSFIRDECFNLSYKFNTYKVYGVKTEHALQIDMDNYDPSADPEAYPASIRPEIGYKEVPESSTLTEIRNVYKIIGFDEENHVLTIEPLRSEKYETGSETPVIIEGSVTPVFDEDTEEDADTGTDEGTHTGDTVFNDVFSDNVYFDALTYLKENGIVGGYPDGSFKPDNTINRAELSKIIVEAAFDDKTITDCAANYTKEGDFNVTLFSDVVFVMVGGNEPPWYFDYVCVGKKNGFLQGYPDGTFKPAQDINFVEAAKIITAGFGTVVPESDPWYKGYVDELAGKNAIPATITTFDRKITRGEMSEIIYRIKANVTDLPSNTYSDLT